MKVLVVKANCLLSDEGLEKMKQHIAKQADDLLRQCESGGVVALDERYKYEVVEVDALMCEGDFNWYVDDGK